MRINCRMSSCFGFVVNYTGLLLGRYKKPNKVKTASSPSAGFLVSLDDFYLLGSGLMMTQTTNNVFNSSLFDTITPSSLLAWQRVRLAHSLAHSGEEWAQTFSKYNSGEGSSVVIAPSGARAQRHF